jgi:hypothetical protein
MMLSTARESERSPFEGETRVPGPRHLFKLSELKRAIKAATTAGLTVSAVEIDPKSGKIVVITGKPGDRETSDSPERIIAQL